MKKVGSKPRTRTALAVPLAAIVLTFGLASPAPARADCLVAYADCVEAAAEERSFWRRATAGLRCFDEFLCCLQRRLI